MELLMLVCLRFSLHPASIFKLAFNWAEIRMKPKGMHQYFLSCCESDKEKDMNLVFAPDFVEDFCLDVLAGRVKIPIKPKQLVA